MNQTNHAVTTVPGDAPQVPDFSTYDLRLGCHMHTGANAPAAVHDYLSTPTSARHVALDIEAAGLGAKSFTMRCVTAAWTQGEDTHTVLLDPRRRDHAEAVRRLTDAADLLILHNASYDVPPLVHYGLMSIESVHKVWDTIVSARMAFPDPAVSKGLESLACRDDLLGMEPSGASMKTAFSAHGISTMAEGWQVLDIDAPVYRLGAMADTVVTLRLAPALLDAVARWLTSNPFVHPAMTADEAYALHEREQVTNRVMLATSARGLKVDTEYLDKYTADHEAARDKAAEALTAAGLDPEAGNVGANVVAYLDKQGELPASWPRTATGKLKADKKAMELLDGHPLAEAQQQVAKLAKVSGYLTKVSEYAAITGRVHPQVGVLGASATGRMSYREPELQQFPHDARGILVPDNPGEGRGWTSIDWSSIEPVVVANSAGDRDFLAGFNDHGADLYEPIVKQAGVTRKVAKVVLLAAMYGQGRALLASNLGVGEDEAASIQAKVFEAMPATKRFLDALRTMGEKHGVIMTADKRLLPIPSDKEGRVQSYKATNYYTQGSCASILSCAINSIHRAGLSDHIQLAMHDELIVDAEAAEAVQQIMTTPPEWFEEFCGHKVVFRTDSNSLPERWRYV